MSSLKYWIWLSSASGIGSVTAKRLLDHFGTPEAVFKAGERDCRNAVPLRETEFKKLADKNTDSVSKILASCAETGCRVVTLQDADYPDRLRNIYDPPLVLYVKGNLPSIDEEAVVAVVGTRDCTSYGITSAENIGYRLAKCGLVVATGLAKGIDSAAARGALLGGGNVIGVIGSGLDIVYPSENKTLFGEVAASGAIVSEYPPGTPAIRAHFPSRNRIISALSLGVAVIEAPSRSGALITASRALEQGRDVFTLPGNIDARSSEGSNALLREGAIPILSADDIISEYADLFPDKINPDAATVLPQTQSDSQIPDSRQKQGKPDIKPAMRSDKPQSGNVTGKGTAIKKEIDNAPEAGYIDLQKLLSNLSGDENAVASAIGFNTVHVDDIIVSTGLPAQRVLTALTMLEIKGCAVGKGGKSFSLVLKK